MKKRFIVCSLLMIAVLVPLCASGGIGVSVDAYRNYDSSFNRVDANEVVISVIGNNTFDKNDMFGIQYSVGYGYPFNELKGFNNVHMSLSSLFDFEASDWLSLELTLGLHNEIYIFRGTPTDQFGVGAGAALDFSPVSFLSIRLSANYIMPLVSFYGNRMQLVALDRHVMTYGISFAYSY